MSETVQKAKKTAEQKQRHMDHFIETYADAIHRGAAEYGKSLGSLGGIYLQIGGDPDKYSEAAIQIEKKLNDAIERKEARLHEDEAMSQRRAVYDEAQEFSRKWREKHMPTQEQGLDLAQQAARLSLNDQVAQHNNRTTQQPSQTEAAGQKPEGKREWSDEELKRGLEVIQKYREALVMREHSPSHDDDSESIGLRHVIKDAANVVAANPAAVAILKAHKLEVRQTSGGAAILDARGRDGRNLTICMSC